MVKQLLTVDTAAVEQGHQLYNSTPKDKYNANDYNNTPRTEASTPSSTTGTYDPVRGHSDIRSPGMRKSPSLDNKYRPPPSPTTADDNDNNVVVVDVDDENEVNTPIPDFITQTDKHGNASTPRNPIASTMATTRNTSAGVEQADTDETETNDQDPIPEQTDACDTLLENLRMMCCCLLPSVHEMTSPSTTKTGQPYRGGERRMMQITKKRSLANGMSTYGHVDETSTFYETGGQIKLLPDIIPEDKGKKCLVLDLDETLVHSSFRAVSGADFVIPVQIEDVVHYVYVAKRPGVDEFLLEMAKHYEIILYTASLNKYADPLLDLLDPHNTIRTRLFRESCVYYEGNYVKDLSLLNRDLSKTIIVDNSPSSYIFHPENAIDCSSFIDDPSDVELHQIGSFLTGIKNARDVRSICNMWREWPHIPRLESIDSSTSSLEMEKYESREDKHVS
jgi:RNA polymerase II subunit A small phosphatase-like protein